MMHLRPGYAGYTLIELIVVISIMVFALGLAGLALNRSLPSSKLDATLREMTSTFRQLRMQAVTTGERRSLVVNLDARQYGPEGRAPRSWPEDVTVEISDQLLGTLVRGEYRFVFYPGGAIEGGAVKMAGGGKKVLLEADPVLGAKISRSAE